MARLGRHRSDTDIRVGEQDTDKQYDGIRRINARDWLLGLTD